MNNKCNLTTCRYNKDKKCTNKFARKECIEVCKKVLCLESMGNDIFQEKEIKTKARNDVV